jgi:sphinganine-1-phosphate aldolase
MVDPIPELAKIAKARNIGLHIDACLGGFVIPWAIENGAKIPKFDFTVDGDFYLINTYQRRELIINFMS